MQYVFKPVYFILACIVVLMICVAYNQQEVLHILPVSVLEKAVPKIGAIPKIVTNITLPTYEPAADLPFDIANTLRHTQSDIRRKLNATRFQHSKAFVITTWRSGSTFLSAYLNAHPGSFNHVEPLNYLKVSRINENQDSRADKAIDVIKNFINCKYDYAKENWPHWPQLYVYGENKVLSPICAGGKWKSNKMCTNPMFLDRLCSIHPIQFGKTVRLPLSYAESILNEIQDLKILYLVRDPRATLQSRKGRDWCVATPSCHKPETLCGDLVNDFDSFLDLRKTFPDRIKVLRYEDMVEDMDKNLGEVVSFFGLEVQAEMKEFVLTHTDSKLVSQHKQEVWNTFRDTNSIKNHWKKEMKFEEVAQIQDKCRQALRLWGYRDAKDEFDLFRFDPVETLPTILLEK